MNDRPLHEWIRPSKRGHFKKIEESMRVLVTGDRNWQQPVPLVQWMLWGAAWYRQAVVEKGWIEVVHGGARGADACAKAAVSATVGRDTPFRLLEREFPAEWDKFGKAAGPIRNKQMLDEAPPGLVLAFHDDLVHSKGTLDMVQRALKADVPVYHLRRLAYHPDKLEAAGIMEPDMPIEKVRERLEQIASLP